MKIIVAGYSKTGTKSMVAALMQLDYKVYDFMDHFWYHGKEWERVITKGGDVEHFRRMYQDVDAVTDTPAYWFWKEIHDAFPDAKIILTTRDNEEKWLKSLIAQVQTMEANFIYKLMQLLSPTGWKYFKFFQNIIRLGGGNMSHPFDFSFAQNKKIALLNYRKHNAYCRQVAPKDKLLIYSVKEGWGPLCKFLGKEIPDKPFPHENIGGVIIEELMKRHPATLQMQREMLISMSLLFGFSVFAAYKVYKGGAISSCFNALKSINDKWFCQFWL